MKLFVAVVLCAMVVVGCTGDPIRWAPSEPQKQAADLAVTDVAALKPFVAPQAEPIRAEAEQAAKVTQTYLGLPQERPVSNAPVNIETLTTAGADAAKRPSAADVAQAVSAGVTAGADAGFGLADQLLAIVGTVIGTVGLGKFAGKVSQWRQGVADARTTIDAKQAEIEALAVAVGELVKGVRNLPADVQAAVKDSMSKVQSPQTRQIVASAKADL